MPDEMREPLLARLPVQEDRRRPNACSSAWRWAATAAVALPAHDVGGGRVPSFYVLDNAAVTGTSEP